MSCSLTSKAKPIAKLGSNLRCSPMAVSAIKTAGFKCVTPANNHFRDYGDIGVCDTISACKSNCFDTGGAVKILKSHPIRYM